MKSLVLILIGTFNLYAGPMLDSLIREDPLLMYNLIYLEYSEYYLKHPNDNYFFYIVSDNGELYVTFSEKDYEWLPEMIVEEYSWSDLTLKLNEIREILPHPGR